MVGDDICLIIDHKFKILGPNTKESSSGVPLKAILHFLETCSGSFPGQGCDILSSLNQAAAGSGGLSRSGRRIGAASSGELIETLEQL